MRFINFAKVEGALKARGLQCHRRERDDGSAIDVEIDGVRYQLFSSISNAIGQRLYSEILASRNIDRMAADYALLNNLNVSAPYIAIRNGEGLDLSYPISSEDLGFEGDVAELLVKVLTVECPSFTVVSRPLEPLVSFLKQDFLLTNDVGKQVACTGPAETVIFASHRKEEVSLHIDVVVSEEFPSNASVYDERESIVYESYYHPRFDAAVRDAEYQGRTCEYKLAFVARWNRANAHKYWRLRACVIANRIVFRMPLCWAKEAVYLLVRESEAMQSAINDKFLFPRVNFCLPEHDEILIKYARKFVWHVVKKVLLS